MTHVASTGKRPRTNVLIMFASIILAVTLFLYTIDASFRHDGRILAPGAAISAPILWISAGLLVLRFPRASIALYAFAAMLLFFEQDNYRGFLAWGSISLILAAVTLWGLLRAESLGKGKANSGG